MTAATRLLDEMCHLTAQSLTSLETSDHFQVVKMLGEGSYGKVMLAVHRERGTPMALKFFPRDSTNLFSFLREYNLSLSFCTHPYLTKALGIAFSTPSHYVFAQQASLFGDLYNVIVPEVGVEEDCVQRVVSQLCGALTHLHALGFVHRDVKPENIFLVDAACRWVKLGDFGMAKATGTKVPGVWYSSAYCTPEAEISKESEDSRHNTASKPDGGNGLDSKIKRVWVSVEASTDCWALGILTYAMLTGSLPWTQTASDDRSYIKYKEWFDQQKDQEGQDDELDLWGEGKDKGIVMSLDEDKQNRSRRKSHPVAPQFACFTPLASSLFLSLLHPQPRLRGRPDDVLGYLGGDWLQVKEKIQLEEEEKKKMRGREVISNEKEREGRGEG
ncbi:serine/threonine-protein kinase SBK1-like isoform X2 [Oncorhynchus tshawytscha]|uniref:serine/threonine-protein kinase SBK1-like isoform X2 n=1 Tax=Oncorhynchus tshawytscha TaxID=74940 RepID=UPI000D0A2981|nr:serine/threonine-protein kinase SBK1-like isoform X2 [Oncorhynchus tshawytscha]